MTATVLKMRAAQSMPESRGARRTVCLTAGRHDRESVLSLKMRDISQLET